MLGRVENFCVSYECVHNGHIMIQCSLFLKAGLHMTARQRSFDRSELKCAAQQSYQEPATLGDPSVATAWKPSFLQTRSNHQGLSVSYFKSKNLFCLVIFPLQNLKTWDVIEPALNFCTELWITIQILGFQYFSRQLNLLNLTNSCKFAH